MTFIDELRRAGMDDHADSVEQVQGFVRRHWKGGRNMPWFTDHGPAHSRRVADYSLQIAAIPDLPEPQRLNETEKYILYCAAWLHDIGMQSLLGKKGGTLGPPDYDNIRHEHPAESRRLIRARAREIGLIGNDTLIDVIGLIVQGHGTKYFLDSAKELSGIKAVLGEEVHADLLAAILLMGDEMDLDARRAIPMPGDEPVNLISEAHAMKHRRVVASAIKHASRGRVGLSVRLEESPNGSNEADELELWIVEKLRMQVAMVDSVFTSGFAGAAELDRAISVSYQPCVGKGNPLAPEILEFIKDENLIAQLIDHKINLGRVAAVIDRHGLGMITGRREGWTDVDGREDVLNASLARARSMGRLTIESLVLYETSGIATLKDVLRGLRTQLGIPGDASDDASDLANELLAFIRQAPQPMVIAISSLDLLPLGDQAWLRDRFVRPLSGFENAAVITTAEGSSEAAGWDEFEVVDSYGMDPKEVEWYLRRYTSARSAKVEAHQSLRYCRYKGFRQTYLAEMAGL